MCLTRQWLVSDSLQFHDLKLSASVQWSKHKILTRVSWIRTLLTAGPLAWCTELLHYFKSTLIHMLWLNFTTKVSMHNLVPLGRTETIFLSCWVCDPSSRRRSASSKMTIFKLHTFRQVSSSLVRVPANLPGVPITSTHPRIKHQLWHDNQHIHPPCERTQSLWQH